MSRYRFIAAEKAQHSVVLLCRVLGVARSAFYAWQKPQPSGCQWSLRPGSGSNLVQSPLVGRLSGHT